MVQMCSIVAAAVLMTAQFARGQQSSPVDSSSTDRLGLRGEEVWIGYSPSSMRLGFLGDREGLSLTLGAVRFSRQISKDESQALYYTIDVVPAAFMSPPLQYTSAIGGDTESAFGPRLGSAFGVGASPLGLTTVLHPERTLQWRFGATGGFLWFDRRVPTVVSTRFNFTAALEAGVQLVSTGGNGILLVYRFHHLSNAGIGYDNSGLASHLFSIGARWR